MSERSGLGELEVAVLTAIAEVGGAPGTRRQRTTRVLERLERQDGLGARYLYPLLQDLGAPWRLHLPLVDPDGNWGSQHGDPATDAQHTRVRLSRVGALALAAERAEVAPVPLGLIEGSLYRDGPVPPFDPRRVIAALRTGSSDAGLPTLPTGGTIDGGLTALLSGRKARLQLGCEIAHEPAALVVTAVPLGVPIDLVVQCLISRIKAIRSPPHDRVRRVVDAEPPTRPDADLPIRIVDVQDESSRRVGVRLVVRLESGSDPAAAERWVRAVWPVTVEVDCRLPAPMPERLRTWDPGDGSGLVALEKLLGPARP